MPSEEEEPLLNSNSNESDPRDRLYFVYVIFYFLGIGTLLPWNFFSNAKQYFTYKLRNVSATNVSNFEDAEYMTDLQAMFESYLTIAAMLPNILFMFLNTAVTKLISWRLRIIVAAVVMIAMFGVAIVFTNIDTDEWQMTFFIITIVSIVLMNAASAVLQGGIFGLSGMFPKEYTQSVMGGMGMGGTIAAVANIMVISIGANPENNGLGYFVIAEIFLILALLGFLLLPHMHFAKHYTITTLSKNRSYSVNSTTSYTETECLSPSTDNTATDNEFQKTSNRTFTPDTVETTTPPSLISIFKQIWMYGLSVFMIFFITLSCYPAINSAIQSSSDHKNSWSSVYFSPVTCFLVFNVCDWIGRTLAGPLQWPSENSPLIPLFSLLRVAFVPLFLLCNIQPRQNMPILFHSDWIPAILMSVFALSNGYLGTLCMMYGPRVVHTADIETAGSMMSFFLSFGLGMGALMSLLLLKVVQQV